MSILRRFAIVFIVALSHAGAQSPGTENTFVLDDPANRVPATLADVDWLVGSWTGDAFGETFEQTWNPPSAGSMVGMFKVLDGDQVNFYELLLLVEEQGSLSLKVRHFSADFNAWEEKEEYLDFPLVKIDDQAIHFSGLSFYRKSADEIHGYLRMRSAGEVHEELLEYRRRQ